MELRRIYTPETRTKTRILQLVATIQQSLHWKRAIWFEQGWPWTIEHDDFGGRCVPSISAAPSSWSTFAGRTFSPICRCCMPSTHCLHPFQQEEKRESLWFF